MEMVIMIEGSDETVTAMMMESRWWWIDNESDWIEIVDSDRMLVMMNDGDDDGMVMDWYRDEQ